MSLAKRVLPPLSVGGGGGERHLPQKVDYSHYLLSVEEMLQKGHVPARQRAFIRREKTIQSIREELYKLKDKDG